MAALLQRSLLHISVDSAAPHIAAAVGTPTLTIYGPSDWLTGLRREIEITLFCRIWIVRPVIRKDAREAAEANAWKI